MRKPILGCVASLTVVACGPADEETTCSGLLPGDLVVTEVLADFGAPSGSSGADEGREWFEIYNANSLPLELQGLVIEHGRPDTAEDAIKRHVLSPLTLAPGDYLVLGNVLSDLAPAHVDYGYVNSLGDLYNTGTARLGLRCGTTVVDEAIYAETSPGQSYALDGGSAPDYLINDQTTSWCETEKGEAYQYEPSNYGTPGQSNPDCQNVTPGTCMDNGTMRPSVPPQVGDLVITEVIPSPSLGDGVAEWFEVRVNREVDLNGLGLARGTGTANVLASATCLRATAGTYLVFAKSADALVNGGVDGVDGIFTFDLVPAGNVRLLFGSTELDSLSWTSVRANRSIQLSDGLTSPADNDISTNLCDATVPYNNGADFGTPGLANSVCGAVTTGMCMDTSTGLLRPIIKPAVGQLVINEWLYDTVAPLTDALGEWIEVRATAPVDLNGVQAGLTTLGPSPIVPAGGACVSLGVNGLAVIAHSATGHGLPVMPRGVFGFDLPNTGARTLVIGIDGTVLNSRSWTGLTTTTDDGKSIVIDSDGTQCVAPLNTLEYTGNHFGTPGTVNSPECPP